MPKQTAKQQVASILSTSRPRSDLRAMYAVTDGEQVEPEQININLLEDNPFQPRKVIDDTELAALAAVIREQGFQGVLVARPHPEQPGRYQLAFGHRRREASRRAGLLALPVVVREFSDTQMVVLAVTENVQRSDLTPLEEGDIYQLMIEKLGYTQERIASEIGKHRGYVVNRLRAARAPEDIRALVEDKPDSLRAITELLKIDDDDLRAKAMEDLRARRITSGDLVKAVSGSRLARSEDATETPNSVAEEPGTWITAAPQIAAPPIHEQPVVVPTTNSTARIRRKNVTEISREDLLARRGRSQLARAIRVVREFLDGADERDAISAAEITDLNDLERLVRAAAERWRPEDVRAV